MLLVDISWVLAQAAIQYSEDFEAPPDWLHHKEAKRAADGPSEEELPQCHAGPRRSAPTPQLTAAE